MKLARSVFVLFAAIVADCGTGPWNSPYPDSHRGDNIRYSAFSERPKHLDPVQSYSENEAVFNAQIYEPPLQYHYLKRPYELVPLTATEVPRPKKYDKGGRLLPEDAQDEAVAFSVYDISIKPGIRYQPHPAFAKSADGKFLYHDLKPSDLEGIWQVRDFRETGTRELVAADYVFQIKRLAHPRLHSPIFGLMSDYIVGIKAYAETLKQAHDQMVANGNPHGYLDLERYPLEGAEVVDRYTYRVKLKGEYPQFVYWLAMSFFAPVPWEVERFYSQPGMVERNLTLDWFPVGTGPYMLTVNDPNRVMVLRRNPNFHGERYPAEGEPQDAKEGLLEDAGKPIPFIDEAIFTLEKEGIPYWNKFLQGYYDASGIGSDNFDQAVQMSSTGQIALTEDMRDKGIQLETAVSPSDIYMGFNWLDPVVGGSSERARKLRQAISIAVDYEEYISIFANGRGLPAQGPIPPGIFGNREGREGINSYVYEWVDEEPKRKSIDEARKLLAEAGYPDGMDQKSGQPLVLYFDTVARGPDDKARLDWLRQQFAKLNLQLVVRPTDYNRFQEKVRKGSGQIFNWGWNADYPDPENFLFLLYGPQSRVKLQGENSANYENPEYDRLFDQMKNIPNGPRRQEIIDKMLEIARRDAPWVWGFHPKEYTLFHAWLSNVKPNQMARNQLKYQQVDPQLRIAKRAEWNQPVVWPMVVAGGLLVVSMLPAVVTYRRRERSRATENALPRIGSETSSEVSGR
ncbi:MAG TPA: ABC transporter substrate-binding protein [Burkholderiales bacterium]|nr:ABC transporter substrate-binding protein [Burkholderiales bacterium]